MAREQHLSLRGDDGDKRRFTRLESTIAADLVVVPDDDADDSYIDEEETEPMSVTVTNISATGLYFVSQSEFEHGQQVWLIMDVRGMDAAIRGKIVRRSTSSAEDCELHGYGVQFLRTDLAPSAVSVILDHLRVLVRTHNATRYKAAASRAA